MKTVNLSGKTYISSISDQKGTSLKGVFIFQFNFDAHFGPPTLGCIKDQNSIKVTFGWLKTEVSQKQLQTDTFLFKTFAPTLNVVSRYMSLIHVRLW